MIDRLKEIFAPIDARLRVVGRAFQSVIVGAGLVFVYLFGVGLTKLSALLFAREKLKMYDLLPEGESYWREAEGYAADRAALMKQV